MKFCPSCRTKLVLTRGKQRPNTSLKYQCIKCGYLEENSQITQKTNTMRAGWPEEVIVVIGEDEQELRTTSTTTAECPKCHNNQAYIWQVQTRSADEGPTQFFRCTKCSFTWRLYT